MSFSHPHDLADVTSLGNQIELQDQNLIISKTILLQHSLPRYNKHYNIHAFSELARITTPSIYYAQPMLRGTRVCVHTGASLYVDYSFYGTRACAAGHTVMLAVTPDWTCADSDSGREI